ncbi:ferrochelatase-2, chloroplastic-like, partial [Mangifera indica]|uniref:ferrochelatase-2, chloroplastic-like n=1 Tax=Mangifera indica TaxID=29780 RepID=UPI001CFA0A78
YEHGSAEYQSHSHPTENKVGVLPLNLGGPETVHEVQPFLFNLFADLDIIRLPRLFQFIQWPLANLISVLQFDMSCYFFVCNMAYCNLKNLLQAHALRIALEAKNLPVNIYVGMRYWYLFTECPDSSKFRYIWQLKRDKITRLVVQPLYLQFSISAIGLSILVLEKIFREDAYLSKMPVSIIRSWYHQEGYIKSMADLIQKELGKFLNPEEVMIFFSAHGVPVSFVENAGDIYRDQMEECVRARVYVKKKRGSRKAKLETQVEGLTDSNGRNNTGKLTGEQSGEAPGDSNLVAVKVADRQQKYGDLLEKKGTLKELEAELARKDWWGYSEEPYDKSWEGEGEGEEKEKKK